MFKHSTIAAVHLGLNGWCLHAAEENTALQLKKMLPFCHFSPLVPYFTAVLHTQQKQKLVQSTCSVIFHMPQSTQLCPWL